MNRFEPDQEVVVGNALPGTVLRSAGGRVLVWVHKPGDPAAVIGAGWFDQDALTAVHIQEEAQ